MPVLTFTLPPHILRIPPHAQTPHQIPRRKILPLLSLTALSLTIPPLNPSPTRAATLLQKSAHPILSHLSPLSPNVLLWRGSDPTSPAPTSFAIRSPTPDLLSPSVYTERGAAFFAQMQHFALPVSPDRAHIAAGDRAIAAEWGPPVSVWPVGQFSYAYWRNGLLIYDDDLSWEDAIRERGPMVFDQGLRQAVAQGKEVMFQADAFVEIGELLLPAVLDELERIGGSRNDAS